MARVKLGAMFADLRGKLQNAVYSVVKRGVHTVRNIPAVVFNPRSGDQSLIREYLLTAAKRWYDVLTATQRAEWNNLADILATLPSEGGGGILKLVPDIGMKGSGLNAYCAFYARSFIAGLSGFWDDDAPVAATPPNDPVLQNLVFANDILTVSWTDPTIVEQNSKIAVWLRSHEPLFHRQIGGYAALALLSLALDGAKGAGGIGIPFSATPGARLIVQLQTVQPNGWASPGSQAGEIVVP